MALPNTYTQVYGQIPDFLKKIQEGQAPSKFTQQHLKDIGFASTSHRSFIPMLKAIGFLSSDGAPTSKYHSYRDHSQSRAVLGEAIKEAYAELFLIKSKPKSGDKALIEGKFKSAHNCKDRPAELMTKTFFALLALADIDHAPSVKKTKPPKVKEETHDPEAEVESAPKLDNLPNQVNVNTPGLHYNIQIHLPATKDIEVYNAIFKSLKGHLIG